MQGYQAIFYIFFEAVANGKNYLEFPHPNPLPEGEGILFASLSY